MSSRVKKVAIGSASPRKSANDRFTPMRQAILWDNDGVLVDSEELFYEANRRFFAAHGLEISLELYLEHFLRRSAGVWHLFRERGWSEERVVREREERNALYAELLEAGGDLTMPGIETVLRDLAPACRMAVVTSSERAHFEQIHRRTRLLPYFEQVVAAGDYSNEKPHPEPYLTAAARLGVDPGDCLAVEDSPRGLAAAVAAGMPCIVLRSRLSAAFPVPGAFAVVDSTDQLHAVLRESIGQDPRSVGTERP